MPSISAFGLFFALAIGQSGPASRPASQAVAPVGGKITDLYGELTVIYELGDNALRAKESWRFRNEGSSQLAPELFQITLPSGSRRIRLDENSAPFNLSGTTLGLESPLKPGEHNLGLSYEFPLSGGTAEIQQYFAFRMGGVRMIMENMPGLQLNTSVKASKRTRDLNGIVFAIWDLNGFTPGQEMKVDISGLPTKQTWMRDATLVSCVLILLWMSIALFRKTPDSSSAPLINHQNIMSASARKTRLLDALDALTEDLEQKVIEREQFERRQKALLKELAVTLRQHDLEQGTSSS